MKKAYVNYGIPLTVKSTIVGVQGEERKKRAEGLFIDMAVNFPNVGRDLGIQVPEAHRCPKSFKTKRSPLRHIIIKLPKIKDKEF